MTKLCIKILVKSDSAIESAFPWDFDQKWGEACSVQGNASALPMYRFLLSHIDLCGKVKDFSV